MRTIWMGKTVEQKMTVNHKNPARSRRATMANPAIAPTITAMSGATIA